MSLLKKDDGGRMIGRPKSTLDSVQLVPTAWHDFHQCSHVPVVIVVTILSCANAGYQSQTAKIYPSASELSRFARIPSMSSLLRCSIICLPIKFVSLIRAELAARV